MSDVTSIRKWRVVKKRSISVDPNSRFIYAHCTWHDELDIRGKPRLLSVLNTTNIAPWSRPCHIAHITVGDRRLPPDVWFLHSGLYGWEKYRNRTPFKRKIPGSIPGRFVLFFRSALSSLECMHVLVLIRREWYTLTKVDDQNKCRLVRGTPPEVATVEKRWIAGGRL